MSCGRFKAISIVYQGLISIAESEFEDIIESCQMLTSQSGRVRKLRIFLIDDTFVDIWISPRGRYSYHWNNIGVREYVYRHDNAPHEAWRKIETFINVEILEFERPGEERMRGCPREGE